MVATLIPVYQSAYLSGLFTLVKLFQLFRGDMSKTVQKCADYLRLQSTVSRFGYVKFFAIKFYGECWIGNVSTPFLYFKEGVAYDCYQDLVGADYSIYMFHFGPVGMYRCFCIQQNLFHQVLLCSG